MQASHRASAPRAPCAARAPRALAAPAARTRPVRSVAAAAAMKALIFDCDGVILESEELHRLAYNSAFAKFEVAIEGSGPVSWSESYYDMLQNKVGGGKPKMRWYFGEKGWPRASLLGGATAVSEEQKTKLIDELQDFKSAEYQRMLGSGMVDPRPGVLRLMDEAKAAGLKLAVCSAATKSSCVFTVEALLGKKRVSELDCFLAGDDVDKKKPDPTIYQVAAKKMGVKPEECVVVEDSLVGLKAATGAGMRCIITYTLSTKDQVYPGAERVVGCLDRAPGVAAVAVRDLLAGPGPIMDDRAK